MSSGWFDLTEHSLGTPLKGNQSVQRAFARVQGSSSASNFLEPPFEHFMADVSRSVEFFNMSLGGSTVPNLI